MISDLNNSPIEIELFVIEVVEKKTEVEGKLVVTKEEVQVKRAFKIAKLSVMDIFDSVEVKIKEEYLHTIADMAKMLDAKDRPEFLRSAIKDLPSGARMENMVSESMSTTKGGIDILYRILNTCQTISRGEITSLVSIESNGPAISSIMAYALGQGKKEDDAGDTKQKK